MKNTIIINIFATVVALGITIPLGIFCAVKKFSKFDNAVQVLTIVGYSVPVYIIGLVLIYFFSVQMGWFPISGMNSLISRERAGGHSGQALLSGLAGNRYDGSLLRRHDALCPCGHDRRAAHGLYPYGTGKGLKEKVVIYSHAWRNALLSVVTLIISWFMSVFMGSIVVEQIFQLNGIGQMYYKGLMNQDFDVALAIQMLYCVITLISNLVTDLSYGLVDPRVRIDK